MDIATIMGWVSLSDILLSQIELADCLKRGPKFRRFLLQDLLLWKLVQSLARYIVDIEIDAISANLGHRLASDKINFNALEDFLFKNIKKLQANSTLFFVFLLKTSAGVQDCGAIWGGTPADLDLNNDHQLNNNMNSSNDADPNADSKEDGKMIQQRDNMLCIADHSRIE